MTHCEKLKFSCFIACLIGEDQKVSSCGMQSETDSCLHLLSVFILSYTDAILLASIFPFHQLCTRVQGRLLRK